jgi:HD-like signal output (HDOD) protein
MMKETAQRIVAGAEIPSIPHILQVIVALTNNPMSSSRELEEKILSEPGLVMRLLKTVNSAYFGLSKKVSSVRHAIVILGYTSVRSIAAGLILINTFEHLPGLARRYVMRVWMHSLAAAGLTRIIAGPDLRKKQDDLFIAALVHNAGHLILAQHFEKKYDDFTKADPLPSVEEERKFFEVDHVEVGALLLEDWKFDREIIDLVRAHHNPASFQGEPAVIGTLVLCELLARKGACLREFLEKEENDLDVEFLSMLPGLGWSWKELQESNEAIIQSIEMTQQGMR